MEAAQKQGDRELLIELLMQEEEYQATYETHKATYDTAMAEVSKIREDYKIFESEMSAKLNELRTLKSQAKMARLRENINAVNARYTSKSRKRQVNEHGKGAEWSTGRRLRKRGRIARRHQPAP